MGMFHRHSRGGKRLQRKEKSKNRSGVRLAALLLCLSMLTGFLPAPARAADAGEKLSSIVNFQSIALHYAGPDGQSVGAEVPNNALLGKDDKLILRYTYTITEEQCKQIVADTRYYLEVSPHLVLPDLDSGSPLTMTVENDDGTKAEKQFGIINADGASAWVEFLADTDGTLLLGSDGILDAYFYLDCTRAADVPADETPIGGNSNLYAMKFENNTQLNFGYAENEPVSATAQINKGGSLKDKTITWTIDYTPWQNPAPTDPVALDTPFELRDTIDTSLHSFVDGSVTIGETTANVYTARGDIPADAETYVLVETPADGGNTTLTFGGTKFNAGQATQGDPAKPLNITYQTAINDELLLPGGTGGKKVSNAVELFAGENGVFNSLNISSSKTVTIPQPTWLTKTGNTTRDYPNGSYTDWTVTFQPNGFDFVTGNNLTLYDQLPSGSTLVDGSVKVGGAAVTATTGANNDFTISPITTTTNSQPVTITYQSHVPEDMYDSGTSLGSNIAYFTFDFGDNSYTTPQVKTPIGSGDGSGTPGTATLVKENSGYNAATRTIDWTVKINPHQANLRSGTFTDNLGAVGPQTCTVDGHSHGLELVNGTAGVDIKISDNPNDKTGKEPTDEEKSLIELGYDRQVLTVTVKKGGENVIGAKTIILTYTTKVCDPCIFANNTAKAAFKNTISTTDMMIGSQSTTGRSASADSTANVSATVLTKKAPVYDYASGTMKWSVEVDAAGLSMADVVLTDDLPAGLTYVENSLVTTPEILDASASVNGQTLTIDLGTVAAKTTVTFDTKVDPEILGFGGDQPVVVENTIRMNGKADGVEFAEVSHHVQQSFSNHGLVKSSAVNNQQEFIQYEVLINPYHLALPENPSLVDTLDSRLQLDTDTLMFYEVTLSGTTAASGQKPGYKKTGDGQSLKITGFDPATNSFTVQLPISADNQDTYVLTYTADIIDHQAGGYSNSVRFDGGSVLLGGSKNNSAAVGGGGGGGGGGVAARKATISIVKTDSETQAPLSGVSFLLYQWDSDNNTRGLPFAQGATDSQGKLSFKVKPGAIYELVEDESVPGYGSEFSWTNLPDGAEETDNGLLITAGAPKSELKLELTNEAHTTDIVFRLVNKSGIPMAGAEVQIFTFDPTGQTDPTPVKATTVSPDGTVKFPGMRRGVKYYIQRPDGEIMSVDVPAEENELPTTTVDGKTQTLTEDYRVESSAMPEQEWTLTVNKVISGGDTPLAGATIGLYADADCQTLIKTGISEQDGTITFSGLIKGQSYWLKETAAPNGYQLNSKTYEGTEGTPNVTIENAPSPVNPGNPGAPSNPGNPSDPSNPGIGSVTTGDPNIPQTGDNTQLLVLVTLLSGIALVAMTLYRFLGQKSVKKSKLFRCFYILILIIFIIFGTALVIQLAELQRGNEFYEQIEKTDKLLSTASVTHSPPTTSPVQPAVPKDQECEPILPTPHELSLRLSHFVDEYSDAAIWLQIPDTPLDYPVMLGADNQFYLNHLPNGNKNALGSLFLDYRTNEDSVHLIVYGHNGSGGKMFGLLKQYESQDYFLEHKTLTVATSDAVYVCPIFSVRRVEAGGNAYRLEFEDNNSLTDYINQAAAESLYQIDVELEDVTRVLTLSTCTGWLNQRFIVQAVMR